MNAIQMMKYWLNGITKPEKTVSELVEKKLTLKDGIISAGLLGLIIGIIFFIITSYLFSSIPSSIIETYFKTTQSTMMTTMFIIGIVLIPIIAIVGLLVITGLYRLIAKYYGGKLAYDKNAGFFGIIAGSAVIAQIPTYIFTGIGLLGMLYLGTDQTTATVLAMFGAMISTALGMMVYAEIFESLNKMDKISMPKAGLFFGITMGLITFLATIIAMFLIGDVTAMQGLM